MKNKKNQIHYSQCTSNFFKISVFLLHIVCVIVVNNKKF